MNEISIIINGVRYDAVEDTSCCLTNNKCDLYDYGRGCNLCIIGMDACEQLIGVNGIFKKSNKKFEK